MSEVVIVEVQDELDVGRARRAATALCQGAGFSKLDAAYVTTSVSELAHNLVRHAGGGTIILRLQASGDEQWIEVVAEDHGPGIADIALAMQDGYSTAGGLGSGLPGVRRMMDDFGIASTPHVCTRVTARKWATRRKP